MAYGQIDRLRDKQAELRKQSAEVLAAVETENRELTAEERATLDALRKAIAPKQQ